MALTAQQMTAPNQLVASMTRYMKRFDSSDGYGCLHLLAREKQPWFEEVAREVAQKRVALSSASTGIQKADFIGDLKLLLAVYVKVRDTHLASDEDAKESFASQFRGQVGSLVKQGLLTAQEMEELAPTPVTPHTALSASALYGRQY